MLPTGQRFADVLLQGSVQSLLQLQSKDSIAHLQEMGVLEVVFGANLRILINLYEYYLFQELQPTALLSCMDDT